MANTTLGTAYVQIIPSAHGIKSKIASELEPEMNAGGQKSGQSFGKKLVSSLKGVISVAAIGKFIADSISEGGKLQQSIGGIETLFAKHNAFKIVENNAKSAFKNVGVSANQYMEDVTGFAATLISGCSGDTRKAAKYADVAMRDMADNANKMGTDMGSIRYAYQGFAKQNYTMLDNLKLGYGGTASEMARLVNDSGVLGKDTKVTADTVKNVPFNKIIEAIHKTQQGLGITGTTAKEAATTFTGSFGMMKAAWQDFLGQLSTGGNVKSSMTNLLNAAKTFIVGNFLPMLKNIAKGLPAALNIAGQIITPMIPTLVHGGVEIITALVNGIAQAVPTLTNAAIQIGLAILRALGQVNWAEVGKTVMSGIGQGFQINAPATIALLTAAGVKGGKGFAQGISTVKDVIGVFQDVKGKASAFSSEIQWVLSGTQEASTIKNAFGGIKSVLSSNFDGIKTAASQAFNGLKTIGSGAINGLKTAISGIGTAFSALGSFLAANPFVLIIAAIAAAVVALVLLYNKSETFRNFVNSAAATIKSVVIGAWNGIKAAFSGIGTFFSNIGNTIKNAFMHPVQTIFGFYKTIWTAIFNVIKGAIDNAKAVVASWVPHIPHVNNPLASLFGWVSGIIGRARSIVASWIPHIPHVNNPFSALGGWIQNAWNRLTSFRPHIPKIGIEFGHIKLPHIHVNGTLNIAKGEVPHVSVDWYAKGGIFQNPSIIGVGESGPEAVLPIEKLQTMINRSALSGGGRTVTNNIEITVNGAEGQDVKELSELVADEMIKRMNRLGAMIA